MITITMINVTPMMCVILTHCARYYNVTLYNYGRLVRLVHNVITPFGAAGLTLGLYARGPWFDSCQDNVFSFFQHFLSSHYLFMRSIYMYRLAECNELSCYNTSIQLSLIYIYIIIMESGIAHFSKDYILWTCVKLEMS